jgi:hypothetical protein
MIRLRIWLLIVVSITIALVIYKRLQPASRIAEVLYVQSAPTGRTFCVTNCTSTDLLFALVAVETQGAHGWSVYTNYVPAIGSADPFVSWNRQTVGSHGAWLVTVPAPVCESPWRLRVRVSRKPVGFTKLREWKRVCDEGIVGAHLFSWAEYRSFRSYGDVFEPVSDSSE